jgi:hypothetical protein
MIEGIRTITEQSENGLMVYIDDGVPATPNYFQPLFGETTQWKGIDNKAMAYHESYIDLSGYELEDLTVAPISVIVQDPGIYMFTGSPDVIAMYDLVTMERLSEEDLANIKSNMTTDVQSAPGMAKGPLDRSQIIFGQFRLLAQNTTVSGLPTMMLNARTVRFGSGNPTAVSKVWCYRILAFVSTPAHNDRLTIPAATFVLNVDVVKEGELPYIMRLKRSYELATGN